MIGTLVRKFQIGFSRRPQRYQLRYEVGIGNPSSRDVPMAVVCPVPPDTDYQKVSNLSFQPNASGSRRERRYGNTYAWWDVVIPSGGGLTLAFTAVVDVRPRRGVAERADSKSFSGDEKERCILVNDEIRHSAKEIVGDITDRATITRMCYEYVISHLRYGHPINGLYRSDDALRLPEVDCGGFATLLGALLRAHGIPARLVVGFWAGHRFDEMHAWLECEQEPNQWMPLDPSVDYLRRHRRTKKTGGFGHVGSDRIVVSHGCDLPIEVGNRAMQAPILQHPVILSEHAENVTTTLNFRATRV